MKRQIASTLAPGAIVSFTVLELFAGIGGLRAAWPESTVAAAYDINSVAAEVYRENFAGAYRIKELASTPHRELHAWAASCWWISPPCQPFCRLGARRDAGDHRSAALAWLTKGLQSESPQSLVLENVIGFQDSSAWRVLRQVLESGGYQVASIELCPSQMGWPNLRPRFYAIANRGGCPPWSKLPKYHCTLSQLIESKADCSSNPSLWLDVSSRPGLGTAIDRIDRSDCYAKAACFTSAYGKALLKAGSYLLHAGRYRRFTPREVARLLGFPEDFRLGNASFRTQWKLLGQSLSLPAVRYVLSHLPNGPTPEPPWLDRYCPATPCPAEVRT